MARIRTVKPEFWVDEKVVELSPWARLLFIGLWNFADDQGYIDFAPKRIKMQVFPGDTTDVVPLIDELLIQGVLRAYRSPIGPVLHVINWQRHQRVDHPAKVRFDASQLVALTSPESSRDSRDTLARPLGVDPPPPPDLDARTGDENDHQTSSRGLASVSDGSFPRSLEPSTPPIESGTDSPREDSRTLAPEGNGREGNGRDLSSLPPPAGAASPRRDRSATAIADKPQSANAAGVVAAYIAGAVNANLDRPAGSLPARVGRDAKQLLAEGIPLDKLIAAATAMGQRGYNDLAVQLQYDSAQRNGQRDSRNHSGNSGWDGPYLNPTDPHAYDGYRNDFSEEGEPDVA